MPSVWRVVLIPFSGIGYLVLVGRVNLLALLFSIGLVYSGLALKALILTSFRVIVGEVLVRLRKKNLFSKVFVFDGRLL